MSSARQFDRSSVPVATVGKEGLIELNLAKPGAKKAAWKSKYVVVKPGAAPELPWFKNEKSKGGKAEGVLALHDTTTRPGSFAELGQFESTLPAVKEMHRDFSRAFSACAGGSGTSPPLIRCRCHPLCVLLWYLMDLRPKRVGSTMSSRRTA